MSLDLPLTFEHPRLVHYSVSDTSCDARLEISVSQSVKHHKFYSDCNTIVGVQLAHLTEWHVHR